MLTWGSLILFLIAGVEVVENLITWVLHGSEDQAGGFGVFYRYMASFVDPATTYEYSSAEQYMMAGKVCAVGF